MLERLRQMIEDAIGRLESRRVPTADDVDRILHGMREELIDLRARLPRLQEQLRRLEAAAANAVQRAETLRDEAGAAGERGDADGSRARMDEARHALTTAEDLHRRAGELRTEVDRLRREADERASLLRDARRNRDALIARARRSAAREKLQDYAHGPDSGLQRFDRLEEEIEEREDLAEAAREVQAELEGHPTPEEADRELRQLEAAGGADEIDRRLRELKREMLGGGDAPG